MKIILDKIETVHKLAALGSRRTLDKEHFDELYFDTELQRYVVIRKEDQKGGKFSGRMLLEPSSVGVSQVAEQSVPAHQPIGTPPTHDTPTGSRKKKTVAKSKSVIAERIEARAASNKSAD